MCQCYKCRLLCQRICKFIRISVNDFLLNLFDFPQLWANGTVILRDTNVTEKIDNTVSQIILNFVGPPAMVTKLIGENYEKLDKDLKCCEVY